MEKKKTRLKISNLRQGFIMQTPNTQGLNIHDKNKKPQAHCNSSRRSRRWLLGSSRRTLRLHKPRRKPKRRPSQHKRSYRRLLRSFSRRNQPTETSEKDASIK